MGYKCNIFNQFECYYLHYCCTVQKIYFCVLVVVFLVYAIKVGLRLSCMFFIEIRYVHPSCLSQNQNVEFCVIHLYSILLLVLSYCKGGWSDLISRPVDREKQSMIVIESCITRYLSKFQHNLKIRIFLYIKVS